MQVKSVQVEHDRVAEALPVAISAGPRLDLTFWIFAFIDSPSALVVLSMVLTPNQVHFQVEKFWFTGTSFL